MTSGSARGSCRRLRTRCSLRPKTPGERGTVRRPAGPSRYLRRGEGGGARQVPGSSQARPPGGLQNVDPAGASGRGEIAVTPPDRRSIHNVGALDDEAPELMKATAGTG